MPRSNPAMMAAVRYASLGCAIGAGKQNRSPSVFEPECACDRFKSYWAEDSGLRGCSALSNCLIELALSTQHPPPFHWDLPHHAFVPAWELIALGSTKLLGVGIER